MSEQKMMMYCPRCGNFEISDDQEFCPVCNIKRLPTNTSVAEYRALGSANAMQKWQDDLLNDVVRKNPLFSESARDAYRKWSLEDIARSIKISPSSQVHCPRCNSTQIQLVQRKWSFLTGFLTNKVDRVCMKCKHRF